MSAKRPQLIAHRPRDAFGRSNCLSAIRNIRPQTDIIELDIRQTADGGLVVLHDALLEAVSDRRGHIGDLNSSEALKIALKPPVPASANAPLETIPSLQQAFECCDRAAGLYLDCRAVTAAGILKGLRSGTLPRPLLVCSSDQALLAAIAEQLPQVRRVTTWRRGLSEISTLPAYATDVEVFANDLSESLVQALRAAGQRIGALTLGENDTDVDWHNAARLGVDWLMTDNPVAARRTIGE